LGEDGKPLRGRRDCVFAGCETADFKRARFIGRGRAQGLSGCGDERNVGVGDDGAGRVGDLAAQGPGASLRHSVCGKKQKCENDD